MKLHTFADSNIYVMDETPVWLDVVSSTTVDEVGAKDIPLKTSGHVNVCVSVCNTIKEDSTKLKPFILFLLVQSKRQKH